MKKQAKEEICKCGHEKKNHKSSIDPSFGCYCKGKNCSCRKYSPQTKPCKKDLKIIGESRKSVISLKDKTEDTTQQIKEEVTEEHECNYYSGGPMCLLCINVGRKQALEEVERIIMETNSLGLIPKVVLIERIKQGVK